MIVKRAQDLQLSEVRDSLRRADLTVRFPVTATVGRPAQVGLQEAPARFKHEADPSVLARTGRIKIRELLAAGIIQAPREIEITFKGQRFTATIEPDGLIHFDGQTYASPSHAGGMVRNKVNGPPPDGRPYWSTNGWTFWHYKDPVTGYPQPISTWLERLG